MGFDAALFDLGLIVLLRLDCVLIVLDKFGGFGCLRFAV